MRRVIEGGTPPVLGLRHVALRVRDVAATERFFVELLGYRVEWRPDAENVYLARRNDNLAVHRSPDTSGRGMLDHIGLAVPRAEDVDAWATWLEARGADISARPRTHRDGARSLYLRGPEGILVQIIHHANLLDPA
ncbi:MAG TPA: VOC family protein [Anaeromyxobacteraceae bacterium]|nr:VOC family protein [Anaeromyxobacteraceae bacterium]